MARTNAAAVKKLMAPGSDYDLRNTPDLDPFIETASAVVDDVVDCATDKDVTLSAAKLELIERWLAAHFYAVSDQPYSSKSTEGASASFQGQTGMYFEGTKYGQTAVRLDPSGCLAAIGGAVRNVAGGFWLGKPPSDQLDYVERD